MGSSVLLLGDNTRFAAERVDVTAHRFAGPAEEEGESFPFGVRGLVPVVTERKKKGGHKTVYAFPFAEGEPDPEDALAGELCAAVDFVNVLLGEARELSGFPFGTIGALWMGVTDGGYSFTRVEEVFSEGWRLPSVHLRLETSDVAGEPGSLSAVLEYDAHGYLRHVLITERGEGGSVCRIVASDESDGRDVLVDRVVEATPGMPDDELYRRRWRRDDDWRA